VADETRETEIAGGNTADHDDVAWLERATGKVKQLLEILDLSPASPGSPDPARVLRLLREVSACLERASESNTLLGDCDALSETRDSTRSLVQFLVGEVPLDVHRVRMAAAFLECRLGLLASMIKEQ